MIAFEYAMPGRLAGTIQNRRNFTIFEFNVKS